MQEGVRKFPVGSTGTVSWGDISDPEAKAVSLIPKAAATFFAYKKMLFKPDLHEFFLIIFFVGIP